MQLVGYLGLFVWCFLAATVVPLSSEIALVTLVQAEQRWLIPVLVATTGNYLGACTTYWIGRRASQALGARRPPTAMQRRAAAVLRRYGQPSLLLSAVPLLGDALVALAGASGVPFGAFSFWVVLGKGGRYVLVAWATLELIRR